MELKDIKLTETDYKAILLRDTNYINNKGAKLYTEDTYTESIEYYRLAAAMGNTHSISNLGYCYLYGRSIEPNTSLAIAYFQIAALREDIDAAYKLGDIYGSDKWGVKDIELSIYYYRMAASYILDEDWDNEYILYNKELLRYPSLCFALGRESMPDGNMNTSLDCAYQFLMMAKEGYEKAISNGNTFYEESYNNVLKRLDNECFNDIKEKYNKEDKEESFE